MVKKKREDNECLRYKKGFGICPRYALIELGGCSLLCCMMASEMHPQEKM